MKNILDQFINLTPEQRKQALEKMKQKGLVNAQTKDPVTAPILAAPRGQTLPLSFSQQRLWFLNQLEGSNASYNIPAAIQLSGQLSLVALQSALDEIIRRHEVLRTTFPSVDGKPFQQIVATLHLPITVVELEHFPAADRHSKAMECVGEEARRPFDLEHGPLLRAILYRLEPNEHIILLVLHHIVTDGWSGGVLFKEVAALYESFLDDHAPGLPELPIQYADYAVWQHETLQGDALQKHLDYARNRLSGFPATLALPTDRPRPTMRTNNGALRHFTLPADVIERVKTFSAEADVTPFMTLLAVFQALLERYSGQSEIVVGSPIANRNRSEIESLIGFFTNTLVLPVRFSDDITYRQLLSQVREVALDAYEHQDLPFDKLVEELQVQRDLRYHPIFQVMFALHNFAQTQQELPGLRMSLTTVDTQTARFDLFLELEEEADEMLGRVEYNADLFDAATVDRLIGHYQVLLENALQTPDRPLSELPLLTQPELEQILRYADPAPATYTQNKFAHQLFEEQAARTPDAVAVIFDPNIPGVGEQNLTYHELNTRANQAARRLQKLGVGPDVLTGLCLSRSLEMVIGILAILKAGGAYLPLDPDYPQERLEYMLADSKASVLLTESRFLEKLASIPTTLCFDTDADIIAQESGENLSMAGSPENLIYVIYTSGSTGKPKGVMLSHANVVRLLAATDDWFHFGQSDVWTLFHSYAFDFSVWELWGALAYGGSVVVVPYVVSRSPEAYFELLLSHGVTVLNQTPSAFQQLAQVAIARPERLEKLRYVIFGGEKLEPATLRNWFNHYGDQQPQLINMYGITETTVHVTYHPMTLADLDANRSIIGHPIPDLQTYVLDEHLQPAPIGLQGELYVGGAGLGRGYLYRPELTAERFVTNPFLGNTTVDGGPLTVETHGLPSTVYGRLYRTGDLARYLPDGRLEYLGRIDHQVKIRGFRIELGEIEAALSQHPAISETLVMLREDTPSDTRLVAYYVSNNKETLTITALRQFLGQRLPEYMIPATFVALTEMPLGPTKKIDRKALPAPENARPELEKGYVPPHNLTEELIVNIWQDVLEINQVGVDDNFFELGGHSLLATQVIYQIGSATGVQLPLRVLFEAPTVAGLAAAVETQRGQGMQDVHFSTMTPNPADADLPFPLTDIQQAYWVGRSDAFQLGNIADHIYVEYEMKGLDLPRLNDVFQTLIMRHGMLRAIVRTDGRQQILPDVPYYTIQVHDLRGQADAEMAMLALRDEMSHQVMDPARWPLFDMQASQLGDGHYRLHLGFDLLLGDAWSLSMLMEEVLKLYNNPGLTLKPLEATFRDYVLADRAMQPSPLYQQALHYWQERAKTLPPGPDLPLAQNPAALEKPTFTRHHHRLLPEDWKNLKDRAIHSGLTPSGILVAAFAEVLTTWSKSPHFTINLTLFNRIPVHPEVNEIFGDFTSVTLLEVDHSQPGTFKERALRLREQLWADLDQRYISGVQAIREIGRVRGNTSNVTMPVVFTSILNLSAEQQESFKLGEETKLVYSITQTPQVWIDFQVYELDGSLEFNCDAVEEIFPTGLLDDFFGAYCDLLYRLARDPQTWNEPVPNLIPAPQMDQRRSVNATAGPISPALLHTLFAAQAAQTPDATAVLSASKTLAYREVEQYAHSIGAQLRTLGAKPNTLVAIVMEKGWEQIVAALGVLYAGAAYLPIDPHLPQERLWYLLDVGRVEIALTQPGFATSLTWPRSLTVLPVGAAPLNEAVTPLVPVQTQTDLAYVIFTSGSTGLPKGVMIDHRGAVNTVLDVNARFNVGPQDRVLALSALNFDLSVYDIFGLLAVGGAIVIPDPALARDPSHWADLLLRERVTLWNSVPALMKILTEYLTGRKETLPASLRTVMMSGDWIPVDLPGQIHAISNNIQLISMGGATEASIWSILYPIEQVPPNWTSIPYGKAMLNQTFYVFNDRMEHAPVWVPGQLYIGGVGLAKGYWANEEKTQASFITHPYSGEPLYRTGDLGRYLPDGNIEFLGREDFQVKIQGYRIELGEIEAALLQHPAVSAGVVSAVGSSRDNRRLVAYVVSANASAAELREFLAQKLPTYMVPSSMVFLDALPLTANGKVNRQALPDPAQTVEEKPAAAPSPVLQGYIERVAQVVMSILNVESIPASEDLFNFGLNSIDMIRIANQLQNDLDFRPSIQGFYYNPTILGLAEAYQKHIEESGLEKVSVPEPAPATSGAEGIVASFDLILDPNQRAAFKQAHPGLRQPAANDAEIELPAIPFDAARQALYALRRSHRNFLQTAIPLAQFSRFMGALQALPVADGHKYLYGAAGGLYPVQAYIYLKPGAVEGLAAGTYYYHPIHHRLTALDSAAELNPNIHEPYINRPIFNQAGFSIFLVAQLKAIAPLYGPESLHYVTLEAGLIAQLLEMTAPTLGIGLCQIGALNFEMIRPHFHLDETHHLVHSLLGGPIDPSQTHTLSTASEAHDFLLSVGDREVGEL